MWLDEVAEQAEAAPAQGAQERGLSGLTRGVDDEIGAALDEPVGRGEAGQGRHHVVPGRTARSGGVEVLLDGRDDHAGNLAWAPWSPAAGRGRSASRTVASNGLCAPVAPGGRSAVTPFRAGLHLALRA